MPLHTFKSGDGANSVERLVPRGTESIEIDGVTYLRDNSPQGFAMTGKAVGMPPQKEQVRDGYYKLECDKGSRFLDRSPYTAKQIKSAWEF